MSKRIIVTIEADGSAAAFPEPADGIRAAIIDRDTIEAEVLRRLADRVLNQSAEEADAVYPKDVVRVVTASYEADGAEYTLVFPDGLTAHIGDAQDDYMILADVIDRAAEGRTV